MATIDFLPSLPRPVSEIGTFQTWQETANERRFRHRNGHLVSSQARLCVHGLGPFEAPAAATRPSYPARAPLAPACHQAVSGDAGDEGKIGRAHV